ncbi:carbamoyltransferase HypF [Stenomitos frigidus]|uniref:Carbamoyltransferase n=1 Tax=Stenomitos frigidus ULC18 TaxID=2107698 RepID=A0A2T1EQ74_9CYAN|nr:carbamoyltransferase HypF [Stenomitos frigidus]PSB34894.1 carbamoyltransferase HypF [Stenomitos frigidus ULC18]
MNVAFQQRLQIVIQGAVQGVGFRPFIYRLATELGLVGWVNNSAQGVVIEVEGSRSQLDTFLLRLDQEKPPRSHIQSLEASCLNPVGYAAFEIRASVVGEKTAIVLPDLSTCPDCLQEIFDPTNRRYRYPFTNCTNCGPRFSILEALPYDRPNTTMQRFKLCQHCQTEYENPLDRRFHAQPNACPHCGPHLELWSQTSELLASDDNALNMAADAIRQGKIVAIKGIGGFHLCVDARNEKAVQRLRQAKHREAKPFALMYPSMASIKAHCEVSELEAQLLRSPAAPIVLLHKLSASSVTPSVAPNNPSLGIMLPYTPLHHLLMADLGFPVVTTSGNCVDEPICTNEHEAIQRLETIADRFLVHNREIARPVDDSIVRVLMGQETVLRRARGYAPLPIRIRSHTPPPPHSPTPHLLAVGAHLKNTIAFSIDQQVFVSQHLGDLDTVPAFEAFQQAIASFQQIYDLQPTAIACDLHPDYRSTQFAHQLACQLQIPVIPVQHHYAHVLSCMAEHQLEGSALGIAWDGTGYGSDGTIWGGEFLHITDRNFQRVAHLRPFRLPGGDKAVREPRRSAMGVLYELFGDAMFEMPTLGPLQTFLPQELKLIKTMLSNQINCPMTSSVGRLFDAIASIIGLHHQTQFEGQAAMALEFAIEALETNESYPFSLPRSPTSLKKSEILNLEPVIIDWEPMVRNILMDSSAGASSSSIAAKFHNTLVEMIVEMAKRVGEEPIVLTGGCFQNRYLTERTIQRLRAEGFRPYWQQRIPPNDGGIALGQIMAALRELSGGKEPCV